MRGRGTIPNAALSEWVCGVSHLTVSRLVDAKETVTGHQTMLLSQDL